MLTWGIIVLYLLVGVGFGRAEWAMSAARLPEDMAEDRYLRVTESRDKIKTQGQSGIFLAAAVTPQLLLTLGLWPLRLLAVISVSFSDPTRLRRYGYAIWHAKLPPW